MHAGTLPDQTTSSGTLPFPGASLQRFLGFLESPELGGEISLHRFRTVLGRRNADVVIEDPDVSRQHAVIERYDQRYLIRDLGSTNGTWVNGKRADVELLMPGDVIQVGGTRLLFRIEVP